ncbi:MAG: hypothetical protein DMG97_32205 [Acidobacteria bacterium]|nr:MAG: hypothetical protein DMG97_32205 [Acidobacteriota bacterium]
MATAFQQLFSDCIFQKVSANYQVRISRAAEHPWTELQDTGSSAVDTKLYTSPPDIRQFSSPTIALDETRAFILLYDQCRSFGT